MAGAGEIFKNDDGKWSFRVLTSKGEVVAGNEGAGFSSKAGARTTLAKLLKGGYNGPITDAATLACGVEITEDTTLQGDLVCSGSPAIIIAADNVTLDLNGFTITGKGVGAGDGDFGDGITISDSKDNRIQGNTVARNGPYSGISLLGASTGNEIRDNVVTDNNMLPGEPAGGRQDMGIRIEGPGANNNNVVANTVSGSGADGIVVLPTCNDRAIGCVGSLPNEGNEITDNLSHRNGTSGQGSGIRLFCVANPVAAANTTVTNNETNENTTHGIAIDAAGNAQPGPTNNKVSGNRAKDNAQFDGFDGNLTPKCGTNSWQANDFGRVNQPCVSNKALKTS